MIGSTDSIKKLQLLYCMIVGFSQVCATLGMSINSLVPFTTVISYLSPVVVCLIVCLWFAGLYFVSFFLSTSLDSLCHTLI